MSLMPPMPSLDSGLRRNDECEGISDAGMTRPTVVTADESGTCFRTNAGWCRTKV